METFVLVNSSFFFWEKLDQITTLIDEINNQKQRNYSIVLFIYLPFVEALDLFVCLKYLPTSSGLFSFSVGLSKHCFLYPSLIYFNLSIQQRTSISISISINYVS